MTELATLNQAEQPAPAKWELVDSPANMPLIGARRMALNMLRPSPFNKLRSERISAAWLKELAENIKAVGVLQPIVVRPITAPVGQPQFEIVAGECRWKASLIAELHDIPVMARELSDLQARELQVFENMHRNELHPLEEAEHYEALLLEPPNGTPRLEGYTADELAARFGKSRTYIYNRLKLLDMLPDVRKAFYAGELSAATAQIVARLPQHFQIEAAKRMKSGWGGEPMSVKQAHDFVQNTYMLQLGKAPFKITDATLTKAGSCRECPKRTGANPDLFNDIKGADVCTDPKCFGEKKVAHQQQLIAQAKEEGLQVIQGKAAKAVKPDNYTSKLKGYMVLDKVHHEISGDKPLSKLLGKDAPTVSLLEDPFTHDIIKVVKTEDAMQVLKDKGVVRSTRVSSTSASEREAEAKRKADTAWRAEVGKDLLAALTTRGGFDDDQIHAFLLRQLAIKLWNCLGSDDSKRVEKLLSWQHLGYSAGSSADADRINALNDTDLHTALLAMLMASDLYVSPNVNNIDAPACMLKAAVILGYDEKALKAERLRDIKAAIGPKAPAKKAPAKKAPAKKAAAVAEPKASAKPAKAPDADANACANEQGPTPSTVRLSKCGKHWLEQHVKVKASKKLGVVNDVSSEGGLIKVRLEGNRADGGYDAMYTSAELLVLPGQSLPEHVLSDKVAWPFPRGV